MLYPHLRTGHLDQVFAVARPGLPAFYMDTSAEIVRDVYFRHLSRTKRQTALVA